MNAAGRNNLQHLSAPYFGKSTLKPIGFIFKSESDNLSGSSCPLGGNF